MTVFDVGANNGKWAVALAGTLENAKVHFHLFECAPYCFEHLEQNARSLESAVIVKKAVSATTASAELHVPVTPPGTGSGLASMHAREDTSVRSHEYQTITVPTVTIDQYMAENGIENVDILKVDVEGHELSVFNGAAKAFERRAISTIMFEFGSANLNSRTLFRDFWKFFLEKDYTLWRIQPGGGTLRVDSYRDELEYFRGCSNLIAVA